jgi:hypothetical protein
MYLSLIVFKEIGEKIIKFLGIVKYLKTLRSLKKFDTIEFNFKRLILKKIFNDLAMKNTAI